MSRQPVKLAAIGLTKSSTHPMMQELEELYVYGVLSQMARYGEVQYKDMATLGDKITLDAKLSYDETLQKLQQICKSTRTHYLFTGILSVSAGPNNGMGAAKITCRLYEAQGNRYIVDEVVPVAVDAHMTGDGALNVSVAELNRIINQTVHQFNRALYSPECLPPAAPFSHSMKAMQLVLRAHQTQSSAEKISLYDAATREDPQMETAYYHLARQYKADNDHEKSIFYYRKTLEVAQCSRRNKAVYATDAGISCALIGKVDFALQWWMKAIEYDPSYINPCFNIANVYEDQGQYEQAEKYFLQAQRLAPDDFRTHFNLARIYSKMGSWEKALTQYREQLHTEDSDPWCHSDVATCYLNLGDIGNAKRHLEKSLALDPEGEAGQYAQLILSGLS